MADHRVRAVNLAHLPPITQATSAAIGSVISNAVVYPIDLLTTRIQTRRLKRVRTSHQRPPLDRNYSLTSEISTIGSIPKDYTSLLRAIHTIVHLEEPSKSWITKFYNGLLIDSVATLINSFVYFYIYTNLNKLNIQHRKAQSSTSPSGNKVKPHWLQSTLEEILIGSLTGIISKAFTCPLNNITIRFQTRRSTAKNSVSRSSFSSSKKLRFDPDSNHYSNENIHSSNLRSKLLLASSSSSSSSSDEDENGSKTSKVSYISSLISTVQSIHRDRGWAGFWSGYGKNCILSLNPSLSLYLTKVINLITKQVMERLEAREDGKRKRVINDSLWITFINSALGSSLSTILTYPLMLSKTLIQSNLRPTSRQTHLSDRVRLYGSKALYTGLSAKLIKVFLAQGITMTIKNWIEARFLFIWLAFNRHHRR